MDWQQARDKTLATWLIIRESIDTADELELLEEINAACELCEKASDEMEGESGRCGYCIVSRQLGGCRGINLRMSEAVVEHDRDTLRRLVDEFIDQLRSADFSAA